MTQKTARLYVRYGRYREGEVIRGTVAADLIDKGMAADITPKKKKAPKKKAAPAKKNAGAAPENKAGKGETFTP